ncbi:putative Electron transfer DM13 domain protein [Vibrio nigripulchritudo SO65]|uniref:DM13 domain-containing protein n=1 Tax=Vibrio nigripulchritudo TaxID=28173 RepID=UPI0003B1CA48|nr:DM13 domain-containing protein [Vibrio nigripulchritudo]CCN38341.1 putative Electron transfer DM13 domain protein [Vibrio nigripulchritudo AM115]CCN43417.1 putative Electron transfer DM13 domain protein [Vibrio nigripulchritudo FTn2]CCN65726.1 putative Electron transfer DM13 domain protein [Vibrio nigripulchritudo POn4]CCN75272.1 putative Electron transfer DM13 domain protein [Vibrio nigripulchritudo SO65]
MKKRTLALLLLTHGVVGFIGFAGGIYALPILTAPPAPSAEVIKAKSAGTEFTAEFKRDLKDSDALHWGEGTVSVGPKFITLMGTLAPGPDYKLYLSPEFVETESDFNRLKSSMVQVGDIKTFENFAVEVSSEINPSDFNSVIVWCESFGQFITAAKYQ